MTDQLLQSEGVRLTHDGKYAEAEEALRVALQISEEPIIKANIQRDLADLLRKKGKVTEAQQLLEESRLELDKHLPDSMLPYCYTVHFQGRLQRQLGNFKDALDYIRLSRETIIEYCLKALDVSDQEKAQELYLDLDYSSILALNKKVLQAVVIAFKALLLTRKYGDISHKKRAIVLMLFAAFPNVNLQFVQRAYFGRTQQ